MNFNSINRVELQGRVGTVRIQPVGDSVVAFFSLMTEETLTAADGAVLIEAAWHNVTAWEDKDVCIDGVTKGSLVHVEGRLRNSRYTAADGSERVFTEVIASSLKVLE